MRYPDVRYEATRSPCYLELFHFNGTYRAVLFRDPADASLAMAPGRAELDVVAIDDGLLPKGANLVSSAGIPKALLTLGSTDAASAWDLIRLRFSLYLIVRRSEYVSEERDADARMRDPKRAARYDRGVAMLNGDE